MFKLAVISLLMGLNWKKLRVCWCRDILIQKSIRFVKLLLIKDRYDIGISDSTPRSHTHRVPHSWLQPQVGASEDEEEEGKETKSTSVPYIYIYIFSPDGAGGGGVIFLYRNVVSNLRIISMTVHWGLVGKAIITGSHKIRRKFSYQ